MRALFSLGSSAQERADEMIGIENLIGENIAIFVVTPIQ